VAAGQQLAPGRGVVQAVKPMRQLQRTQLLAPCTATLSNSIASVNLALYATCPSCTLTQVRCSLCIAVNAALHLGCRLATRNVCSQQSSKQRQAALLGCLPRSQSSCGASCRAGSTAGHSSVAAGQRLTAWAASVVAEQGSVSREETGHSHSCLNAPE
jgi:hypothetical protein